MGFFTRSKKEKAKKREAEFLAPQIMRQANDSIDLINSTKSPETFFTRYDFLIEKLESLVQLGKYVNFTDGDPSTELARVVSERTEITNTFLDRFYADTLSKVSSLKTKKAKQRRIDNFYSELGAYFDKMESSNIEKVNSMYLSLEAEI